MTPPQAYLVDVFQLMKITMHVGVAIAISPRPETRFLSF